MPWNTFLPSTTADTDNIYLPGDYASTITPISITDAAGGVSIIPAAPTKKLRFVNISLEAKAHPTTGKQIVVYVGVGMTPTLTNYSFKLLAGYEAKDLEITSQEWKAIAETGQTIKINIQLADPVIYP